MRKLTPLVIKLLAIVVLMFGFSFALIPLYNVFCDITGLNGKIDIQKSQNSSTLSRYKTDDFLSSSSTSSASPEATSKRLITVEFDTNRNRYLECDFSPEHTALQVTPGKLTVTSYYIKNLTTRKMIVQAIPSISPGIVAQYLKKLECFCFDRQELQPGESMKLPLRFWLEAEIPKNVHRLTLSYTLFDVTESSKER